MNHLWRLQAIQGLTASKHTTVYNERIPTYFRLFDQALAPAPFQKPCICDIFLDIFFLLKNNDKMSLLSRKALHYEDALPLPEKRA